MDMYNNKKTNKKVTLVSFIIVLVLLTSMLFVFAACGNDSYANDYKSFEKALEAAKEKDVPILLYIGKNVCPYCRQFKPEWTKAKEQYGEQVIFYYTQRGKDKEASPLFDKYLDSVKFAGSPGLVWINSDGVAVEKTYGADKCKKFIWDYFNQGLAGWWSPPAIS